MTIIQQGQNTHQKGITAWLIHLYKQQGYIYLSNDLDLNMNCALIILKKIIRSQFMILILFFNEKLIDKIGNSSEKITRLLSTLQLSSWTSLYGGAPRGFGGFGGSMIKPWVVCVIGSSGVHGV